VILKIAGNNPFMEGVLQLRYTKI